MRAGQRQEEEVQDLMLKGEGQGDLDADSRAGRCMHRQVPTLSMRRDRGMGQDRGQQEAKGERASNSRDGYGALALAVAHRVVEFVAIVVVVTLAVVAVGLVDAVVAGRGLWVTVGGESGVDLLGAVVSGRRGLLLGLHHGGRLADGQGRPSEDDARVGPGSVVAIDVSRHGHASGADRGRMTLETWVERAQAEVRARR